jgi:hypothetical protein
MTPLLMIDPKTIDPKGSARGRPLSSRPELSRGWPYRVFRPKGKRSRQCGHGAVHPARASGRPRSARCGPPQQIGQLDRELDALADLIGARAAWGRALQLIELAEQTLEALGQQPLAKIGVLARPRKIGVGNQRRFLHVRISRLSGPGADPWFLPSLAGGGVKRSLGAIISTIGLSAG